MKVQEVILKAISGQLQWWQAAEILGVSCRTMRRWKTRYQQRGYDGLLDRRRHRPSPKRMPLATVRRVLRLYQEQYQGFSVAHFCDQLREQHGLSVSYQWVKTALQTAGLVTARAKRGRHHQRRDRRPLPGMMLYVDGSTHAWIPRLAPAQFDLVAVIDDADTNCYYAQLVQQESTPTVMVGLKEVIEQQGLFCSLYTDRGSHFFHTPKAGGAVDKSRLTEIGRALAQLGIEHIPSYCPQGRGRMERFFGSWQGRLPQELGRAGITTLHGGQPLPPPEVSAVASAALDRARARDRHGVRTERDRGPRRDLVRPTRAQRGGRQHGDGGRVALADCAPIEPLELREMSGQSL